MKRPRVGVVVSEFGQPSEIWALRQAEGFKDFTPVYFAQGQRTDGHQLPEGRSLHLFGSQSMGVGRRVRRKFGLASGGEPDMAYLRTMRNSLLAADLDVILCHFAWNGVAALKAVGSAVPIVCHMHGRDITTNLQWSANRRALQRALPDFAAVVTVGSHQLETLQSLWPQAHSHLIPCGVPFAEFSRKPIPDRAENAPIRFITVGRLSGEKGVFQTLEAFDGVIRANVDGRLAYIGDGPLQADLEKAIQAKGLANRVELLGKQPPEKIAEHLTSSHVYVQHSRQVEGSVEGFGVALTEAGAAGLPLVATSLGGIPDQVKDGENGLLIPPEDIQGQMAAMLRLAQNEPLRREMGAKARQIAHHFDTEVQIAKLEAVLHTAKASRRECGPNSADK